MDKLQTEVGKLSQALGLLNVADKQELTDMAIKNLKTQMADPNSAWASDPEAALEAVKVLAKINTDTIESQRRVIDTLIRYQSAVRSESQAIAAPANNLIPQEVDENSVSNSSFN